jgi:hypothetical protein
MNICGKMFKRVAIFSCKHLHGRLWPKQPPGLGRFLPISPRFLLCIRGFRRSFTLLKSNLYEEVNNKFITLNDS